MVGEEHEGEGTSVATNELKKSEMIDARFKASSNDEAAASVTRRKHEETYDS